MKVAIYGQYYQLSTEPIIKDIFNFFISEGVDLYVEARFLQILIEKGLIQNDYKTFSSQQELDKTFAFMVSIGGDGTMLRAATLVGDLGIPLVGVNAGRLGFLASVPRGHIAEFMQQVIDQNYTLSYRSLIQISDDTPIAGFGDINYAINDVTVSRKATTSMITIETWLNDEYLTSYWADGLIVSTPTGSTGYNLSCGGPILTPRSKDWVITPIAPHNLNARPLVIPDDTIVRLKVSGREQEHLVSLDSRVVSVENETWITLKKANFEIAMAEIPGETFLKTLRNKLLWGADQRN